MKLRGEVFATPRFKEWASHNVVLLAVDCPRSGVSGESGALLRRLGVTGLPTVVFLGADGAEVGRIVGSAPADKWMERAISFAGDAAGGRAAATRTGQGRQLLFIGLGLVAALVLVVLLKWDEIERRLRRPRA